MSEAGPFLAVLWKLSSWTWIYLFRAEALCAAVCAGFLFPHVRKVFRECDKRTLWLFALITAAYFALVLFRTGGQFFTFEDWEELYAGKLVLQGARDVLYGTIRHGTTYPFLLSESYRLFGVYPETAVFLNLALLFCAPVLVFTASRAVFRDDRGALCALLLFCAWPGLAQYAVLAQGKPGLLVAEAAAFSFAAAMAAVAPGRASYALLFILADLAAKTRQEFGVLYPLAFLLWFTTDKDKKKNWWLPFLALLAALLYYPLFVRGFNCHIRPVQGLAEAVGNRKLWLLFPAGLAAAALLKIRSRVFDKGLAFCAVLSAAFLAISAIYLLNPGGVQGRLFLQIAPFLCVVAGPAFASFNGLLLLPFVAFGGFFWHERITTQPVDTPTAISGLAVKAPRGDVFLFPGLEELSEWEFRGDGKGEELSLDGAARYLGADGQSKSGILASAGYAVISGRDVWVIGKTGGAFWAGAYGKLASAGRKLGEFTSGGWRMVKLRFPGAAVDSVKSKAVSDDAVKDLMAGDFKNGEAKLLKALALNPKNTDALLSLASVKARSGAADECKKIVAKVKTILPPAWGNPLRESDMCGR